MFKTYSKKRELSKYDKWFETVILFDSHLISIYRNNWGIPYTMVISLYTLLLMNKLFSHIVSNGQRVDLKVIKIPNNRTQRVDCEPENKNVKEKEQERLSRLNWKTTMSGTEQLILLALWSFAYKIRKNTNTRARVSIHFIVTSNIVSKFNQPTISGFSYISLIQFIGTYIIYVYLNNVNLKETNFLFKKLLSILIIIVK